MDEVTLNAHAKINLSLEITGRRPDGYHEIVSFMQGTGLHDAVGIKKCSQNGTKYNLPHCKISGIDVYLCTDSDTIPTDMRNLAFRGISALTDALADREVLRREVPELVVTIDKRLPVAAGIAGGSGNAAACMLGLDALLGWPFSMRELMKIGASVGADVPFSIFMNASRNREALAGLAGIGEAADSAWTSGIGNIVERAEPQTGCVIMANPGVSVSTKAAYEAMDSIGYSGDGSRRLFVNDLERYTLREQPEAAALRDIMRDGLSADAVLMSGSGPTMVAYYREDNKAVSDMEILRRLTRDMSGVRMWLTDTGMDTRGRL